MDVHINMSSEVRSSKRMRKAATRFGEEKEDEREKCAAMETVDASSSFLLRKSHRIIKKPKRHDEDNENRVESKESLDRQNRRRRRRSLGTHRSNPSTNVGTPRKRATSGVQKCTTKSGIKYVVKPKANTLQQEIDWDHLSIPIQTVTAHTILKASKKLYRPSKSDQNALFVIPSPTHRANIYLRAAKAMAYHEAKALPSHGGRMWTCVVTLQDPQGAYANSLGETQVLKNNTPDNKKSHKSHSTHKRTNQPTKGTLKSPLFLWNKAKSQTNPNTWTLELAALPNLMNQIDVIDIQHGLLKSIQQSDAKSHTTDTVHNNNSHGEDDEYEQLPPISLLSTVAHQDAHHSLPMMDRKWISPDLISFKTRTSAIQHSLELMEREKLIDKVIHGIGNRGGYLKPKKVSKTLALQAGYWRFLRDGIWVIGQEEERILEQALLMQNEEAEEVNNHHQHHHQHQHSDPQEGTMKSSPTNKIKVNEKNAIEFYLPLGTSHDLDPVEHSHQESIETTIDPKEDVLDNERNMNEPNLKDDMKLSMVHNQEHEDTTTLSNVPSLDLIDQFPKARYASESGVDGDTLVPTEVSDEEPTHIKPVLEEDAHVISCQTTLSSHHISQPPIDTSQNYVQDDETSSSRNDVDISMCSIFPKTSESIVDNINAYNVDKPTMEDKYDDKTNSITIGTNKKPRKIKKFVPSNDFRLTPEQVALCYNAVIQHYERVMYTVKAKALFSELADGFDVFRERGTGRYDMTIKEFDSPEFSFLTDEKSAAWMPVVKKILGEDATLVHKGAFLSMPDSSTQVYHQDGIHLTTKYQRPCHAINVFIPLVDLTTKNGPTEFCIGSHYLGHELFRKDMVYTPTPAAGCPLIFDYRLGHRGLGNSSLEPRPLVYLTYTRASKEFRDSVNFSSKSYHKLGEIIEMPLSRKERALKRERN